MLREYLQCIILEVLFESPYASKFSFLGGTCLRIVHGNTRFSEDLDFDNFNLKEQDFDAVANIIRTGLEKQGFETQVSNTHKGAYRCRVRFPGLLYETGLSGHKEEKILIQLDTESQHFEFQTETYLLNRFGVFTRLITTPVDLLLSQKLYAIVNRPRAKGRDYFDVVFLFSKGAKPNYRYLEAKIGAGTPEKTRTAVLDTLDQVDLAYLAEDVKPFLFDPRDVKKVRHFRVFWQQVEL
ncbi:MAG TPA: nucleotidyl transferase AbiEii/AbiGii toxin family protein [Phaeodactylibacter sp.]|nr:nucleotidyl transferase AbiEii/AbiGii toxin family protein [Phaeodactylibacter sp.]